MGRRKSVVGSASGSFDKKAKKRSPFASFKRSESSKEMQIPESPPESTLERPGTSLTEDEPARNPSASQDRTAAETITPVPIAQPEPAAANGASPEIQAGLVTNNSTAQVCLLEIGIRRPTDSLTSSMSMQTGSPSVPRLWMRLHALREKQQGMAKF